MPFDLEVTFTGLNVFLLSQDCARVAVVQPDCRSGGALPPQHPDGDPLLGQHHVGYLRYNLASQVPDTPPGDPVIGPAYEVVHRLTGEEVDFGLPHVDTAMEIKTRLPAMERIASDPANPADPPENECGHGDRSLLKPIGSLWGANAPLVMRTRFSGGSLEGTRTTNYEFLRIFNPTALKRYGGDFARTVTWTRHVEDAEELHLTLTPFDGGAARTITLQPIPGLDDNPVVALKFGNLCAENPLEWPELGTPESSPIDRDFKWLYRLFETVAGQPAETLLPTDVLFPVPTVPPRGGVGVENCIGTRITVPTIP